MNPIERVAAWIQEARTAGLPEPDAMALASVDSAGAPSVRMVLCRGVDERGLRFFTNYESRKARELDANPRAAAVFHWVTLGRQLRVEGEVQRLPAAESDDYFAARPRGHRLSGRASPQSRPIESLDEIRKRGAEEERLFAGGDVPRPDYWGGYRLVPRVIEFWVSGADRLHDRIRFELDDGVWRSQRLAP